MGTGYTRNDTANNIADGNVINASDLDGEFDAVQAAFNGTTGHSHDGTSGEGPQIAAGGIASNAVTTAKILDGNVTTDKIANSNVTLAKMAANSVDSDQYVDGSIDTAHIANDAVTGDKLANNIQIAGTLGVTGETTLTTHLNMGDNDIIKLGASADLQIYHDGSNSVIKDSGTGKLKILATDLAINNAGDTSRYIGGIDGGAVSLYHSNTEKLATTATGIDVTGVITTDGMTTSADINFGDSDKAIFGAGSDLQIYHNGEHSFIEDVGTGNLRVRGTNLHLQDTEGNNYVVMTDNGTGGEVNLYHNAASKLNTKTDGINVTGELQADSLDIDGAGDISGVLTLHNNLDMQDGDIIKLGTSDDFQIYHDGSNSYIKEDGVGSLNILASTQLELGNSNNTEVYAKFNENGNVELRYDDSIKLETKSDGVDITGELQADSLDIDGNADISGTLTMGGNINLQDNDALRIGTGADLRLYHDGSDSYIDDIGTGDLYIRANDQLRLQKYTGENMIVGNVDGAVQIYHDNVQKLTTASDGIYVTGNVQSSSGRYEGNSAGDYMDIQDSVIDFTINSAIKVRIESDGDLHADGDIIAFSTTVPSDERLKTDIEKIENATDKVSQLNGYTFTYKADGKKSAGVIAQEVEKVLPSAVSEKELPLKMDDGVAYKTVQYDQIIGLLIASIKELKQEINELKGD